MTIKNDPSTPPSADSRKFELLRRQLRWLEKKLRRSEADRSMLETNYGRTESLLKRVIEDLQVSRNKLEQHSQTLEETLQKLQATQAQLVEAEKMSALGILVAGIAHEINNPISFIYSNLQPAEEYTSDLFRLIQAYQSEYPEPSHCIQRLIEEIELDFLREDYQKLLNSISVGAERIYEIVRALRTFSRLNESDYKKVDLHENLESTLRILTHRLKPNGEHGGISLLKNYGSLPDVACLPGKLNQVFMNILVNAIDALETTYAQTDALKSGGLENNRPTPTISITTRLEAQTVVIQITNNGPGIPNEILPKLFDPFFTTKPVGKGTGLGLSISYQIVVEQHQGQLKCESDAQGTTFTIVLPIAFHPATTD
ncbi:MAG: ATP-binding protein [Cyanobacteria bacterium P01_A01_bin.15]